MKTIALLIALALATPVAAVETFTLVPFVKVQTTDNWKRYDTLHEAAVHAAVRLEECSHFYECAGLIVQKPGEKSFIVGPVHTSYQSSHVAIQDEDLPQGWKIAADVHSHPCLPGYVTAVFSPTDLIGALMSRTTSFMVDLCTGDVHEFIPGVTRVDETKMEDEDVYLTGGKIVGHVAAFKDAALAHEGI